MAKLRRTNLSGVRRTTISRSDFEMQRNAEIGHFTELSEFGRLDVHPVEIPGAAEADPAFLLP